MVPPSKPSSTTCYEQGKFRKAPERLSFLPLDVLAAKEAWQRIRQTPSCLHPEGKEKPHHRNDASARLSAQERVQRAPASDVADNVNAEILRKPNEAQKEKAERLHESQQRVQEKREEAESKNQRPSTDLQLKSCEDSQ